MCHHISVIVVTYNSDLNKLCSTLMSIVLQKNVDIEIIVSDDGSDNYDEMKRCVVDFLDKMEFKNYKVLPKGINQGTVRNMLNGIEASSNEYVKPISPGDLLFNDDVLEHWISFGIDNQSDVVGGYAVWYSILDKKINMLKMNQAPQNAESYVPNADVDKRVENVIYSNDVFHGVGTIVKKTVYEKYLKYMTKCGVVYAEDLFFYLAVLDDRKIVLYPHNVVWYEYGSGISTSGDSLFNRLIKLDVKRIHTMMEEMIIKNRNKYISYVNYLYWYDVKQPKWYRIINLFLHPRLLKIRIINRINRRYSDTNVSVDFLKRCHRENESLC